jgi:hypothetical protein
VKEGNGLVARIIERARAFQTHPDPAVKQAEVRRCLETLDTAMNRLARREIALYGE